MSESEAMLIGRTLWRNGRARQVQKIRDNATHRAQVFCYRSCQTAQNIKRGNIGHFRGQTQAPGSAAVEEN